MRINYGLLAAKIKLARLEEVRVQISDQTPDWWDVAAFCEGFTEPIGSGFDQDRLIARKIALHEALERTLVTNFYSDSQLRFRFRLDSYPSTSGFAVGENSEETLWRSFFEAAEHQLRFQVSINGLSLERVEPSGNLSEASNTLQNKFDSVSYYRRNIELIFEDGSAHKCFFGLVLGHQAGGTFLGAQVANDPVQCFEHGLVEAWRQLRVFTHMSSERSQSINPIRTRLEFFGSGSKKFSPAVDSSNQVLPVELESSMSVSLEEIGITICRSLTKNHPHIESISEDVIF